MMYMSNETPDARLAARIKSRHPSISKVSFVDDFVIVFLRTTDITDSGKLKQQISNELTNSLSMDYSLFAERESSWVFKRGII